MGDHDFVFSDVCSFHVEVCFGSQHISEVSLSVWPRKGGLAGTWGRSGPCWWQVFFTLCKEPSFLLWPSIAANTTAELVLLDWLVNELRLLERQLRRCEPVLPCTGNNLPHCMSFVHTGAPLARWRSVTKVHQQCSCLRLWKTWECNGLRDLDMHISTPPESLRCRKSLYLEAEQAACILKN